MTAPDQLPELPCQDFVEVVTAYLEGALSATDLRRFEEHLAVCGKCGMYLDQIRATIALTGRVPRPRELPRDLREGLRAAFQGWAA
jgi:anti-sigma factor RsiW